MPKTHLFVSHISEERGTAAKLKQALVRDFLGLFDVFVSSDTESIAAGDEWLTSIENALRDCSIVIILCSPLSIRRPWINFEAGAAWMRKIPLVPACHMGLLPRDLPVPLSLRQGIAMDNSEDLRRLYQRVAKTLSCDMPPKDFAALAKELEVPYDSLPTLIEAEAEINQERDVRRRLRQSLESHKFKWRSLSRLAASAATSEEYVANLLRSDPEVRFSRGASGNIIVGLRSRVGD